MWAGRLGGESGRLAMASPSWLDCFPSLSDDPSHPSQVALRTYALALALSLGPSLLPFLTAAVTGSKSSRTNPSALKHVLRRELGHDGFAFAITLSVGGGAALRHLWNNLHTPSPYPPSHSQDLSYQHRPNINPASSSEAKQPTSNPPSLGSAYQICEPTLRSVKDALKALKAKLNLSPEQETFIANVIASSIGILLLQAGRERSSRLGRAKNKAPIQVNKIAAAETLSPTLDLTLLLVVRTLDSITQSLIYKKTAQEENSKTIRQLDHHSAAEPNIVQHLLEKEQKRRTNVLREKQSSRLDALLFWACSARIMWCFFYEPERLPRSYVKWINTLANVDPRILKVLNYVRKGAWGYANCLPANVDILASCATELGHPASWGDPVQLPTYGGETANAIWKSLGVTSRPGVGGLPCEIVHGDVGTSLGLSHSCLANSTLRGLKAFVEAIAIYIPAHFLPVLMTRPQTLFRPHRLLSTLLGALRSATFLSTFVASYWFAVCFSRSLVLAKIFPFISHDYWDGPFGCMLAGSLVCGSSIWIENGKRRGEMALYVMPKALRACLPKSWLNYNNRGTRIIERIVIILSLSTLLTTSVHRPESLRGLSRWTLSFITNGPNAGFWKRKRRDPSIPATPSMPRTPYTTNSMNQGRNGTSRAQTPNPAHNHSVKYPNGTVS